MYLVPMIRKELVAASAEPMILALLAKSESYGYAIIQEVKARCERRSNSAGVGRSKSAGPTGG